MFKYGCCEPQVWVPVYDTPDIYNWFEPIVGTCRGYLNSPFSLFERVASLIRRKCLELSRGLATFGPFYLSSRLLLIAYLSVAMMPM